MTRQIYATFLINNQNYFKNQNQEQSLKIEGLMSDEEFIKEFLEYTKQATTTNTPITQVVLVTPALDEGGVLKMLQNIENTKAQLKEELADLNEIIKLLNKKNQQTQAYLKENIKAIEDEYRHKIQRVKSVFESNATKINKIYSEQVTGISNKFELEMRKLHKELVKLEKEKEKLEAEIRHAEAEIKTSAINKEDITERKWKETRKRLKEKQPKIASNLKEMQKQIDEAEEKQKNTLFQLKQTNDLKIKEASKDLVEIEASRDAEIKVCTKEIEKVEELTLNIIKTVDELAKSREATLPEFDHIGIKQNQTKNELVYMPFYLSCYQSKTKRYTYLAPSNVSDSGLSTKLKCIGKTKITQLLQPRSKKIISILNNFIGLLDENIVFCREISEACMKANLLQTTKSKEATKDGLKRLKEKGWLSNNEFEQFNQALDQNFSS
jgi:DNA repair exonuclease SbcCD ATPase subunit